MKLICTGDWHLGNLFHGNDRLPEHRHFLSWLLTQITEQQPDALLIAGDVFDNGNPSAAAQAAYYHFLVKANKACPAMTTVITAGNHDSASRLEAPRSLLGSHNIEVRGQVHRSWDGSSWIVDYDDMIIPLTGSDGTRIAVLAVPYLRNDILRGDSYSSGIKSFISDLLQKAHESYPEYKTVMMAHLYASGAEIAHKDASERIVIGGQEQVDISKWPEHPDYFTCGHIHKRQAVGGLDNARYPGSVLPMSFAEKDYTHGVDLVSIDDKGIEVEQLVYTPQHRLRIIEADSKDLTLKRIEKLIDQELTDRKDNRLDDEFEYLALKLRLDRIKGDDINSIEELIRKKNVVLCKIQRIIPELELTSIEGGHEITSIDDILDRDPLETIAEAFAIKHDRELSERQHNMLREIIDQIQQEQ